MERHSSFKSLKNTGIYNVNTNNDALKSQKKDLFNLIKLLKKSVISHGDVKYVEKPEALKNI
jgi:hypothetical protein